MAGFTLSLVHVLSPRSPGPWPRLSDTPIRWGLWSCTASRVHPGHCEHLIFLCCCLSVYFLFPTADSRQELALRPEVGTRAFPGSLKPRARLRATAADTPRARRGRQVGHHRHARADTGLLGRPGPAGFRAPPTPSYRAPRQRPAASAGNLRTRGRGPAGVGTSEPAAPPPPSAPRSYVQPPPSSPRPRPPSPKQSGRSPAHPSPGPDTTRNAARRRAPLTPDP